MDEEQQKAFDEMVKQAENKFSRALIQMYSEKVGFITNVICQLKVKWDMGLPTAATNGSELFINPEFFLGLDDAVRKSLLAHEGWHVAYDHMGRLKERDHKDWNYAADYAINQDLKDSGYTIPSDWLQDDRYKDLTAEQIYTEINSGKAPQPPGFGGGPGQDLQQNQNNPHAAAEIISAAAQLSKFDGSWGDVPGHLKEMIDKLLNPQLPWEVLLEQHLDKIFHREQSWSNRNRMFRDVIVPGWAARDADWANNIVWAFDVSGSVSDEQVTRFLAEAAHVHNTYECERTIVNLFDTQVRATYEFDQNDKIEGMEIVGRGGTHLTAVMELAKKQRPKVLIVFSDLGCAVYPKTQRPDFPVIWLCCDNPSGNVEFGDIIHFDT